MVPRVPFLDSVFLSSSWYAISDFLKRRLHTHRLAAAMELESPLEAPTTSSDSSSLQSQDAFSDENAEAMMNLSLLDPPHWGWSAAGGVVDLLPPHEVGLSL